MISKSYIEKTLQELDRLYNSATSQKKAIYYSKLALLELCGWIEQSMDKIVFHYANHKLKDVSNKKFLDKQIIGKTFGFTYEDHFRKMLLQTIGIISLEKLEKKLEQHLVITKLKSILNTLKNKRNDAAHTHLKGVTVNYDAPSLTISNFMQIYPLLKDIENGLKNL